MNPLHAVHLDKHFELIRHSVTRIQASIFRRLVGDLKKVENLLLTDSNFGTNLGKAFISLVSCFVDDIDIIERFCIIKE